MSQNEIHIRHETLVISPKGHLLWETGGGEETWPDPDAQARIGRAMAGGIAPGLLHLVSRELTSPLPPTLVYWRNFAVEADITAGTAATTPDATATLDDADLAGVFGIELESAPAVPAPSKPARPRKKAATKKVPMIGTSLRPDKSLDSTRMSANPARL